MGEPPAIRSPDPPPLPPLLLSVLPPLAPKSPSRRDLAPPPPTAGDTPETGATLARRMAAARARAPSPARGDATSPRPRPRLALAVGVPSWASSPSRAVVLAVNGAESTLDVEAALPPLTERPRGDPEAMDEPEPAAEEAEASLLALPPLSLPAPPRRAAGPGTARSTPVGDAPTSSSLPPTPPLSVPPTPVPAPPSSSAPSPSPSNSAAVEGIGCNGSPPRPMAASQSDGCCIPTDRASTKAPSGTPVTGNG